MSEASEQVPRADFVAPCVVFREGFFAPCALRRPFLRGVRPERVRSREAQRESQMTLRLVELVKKQIVNGEFQIFSGELRDQNGVIRHSGNDPMTPEEIIRMDWLCDNIKGTIPTAEELVEDAVPMVEIQGIHPEEDSLSERKLT